MRPGWMTGSGPKERDDPRKDRVEPGGRLSKPEDAMARVDAELLGWLNKVL